MKNRKRNRMKGFDYSGNHLYFVTSCVKDRVCCFGKVVGTGRDLSVQDQSAKMVLNEFGEIVKNQLEWLEHQYSYVVLHHYIVMPNHIHAILEIDSSAQKELVKIKSVSELMGAFKSTSSKLIHLSGYSDFAWQRSFHDHIIKDEKSYLNIAHYIATNPERWERIQIK